MTDRSPTEMELRCAKAGYEQAIRNSPYFMQPDHLIHAWGNQDAKLKEDWYRVVRAIFGQARDPTNEMLDRARTACTEAYLGTENRPFTSEEQERALLRAAHTAMLDAASPPEGT